MNLRSQRCHASDAALLEIGFAAELPDAGWASGARNNVETASLLLVVRKECSFPYVHDLITPKAALGGVGEVWACGLRSEDCIIETLNPTCTAGVSRRPHTTVFT